MRALSSSRGAELSGSFICRLRESLFGEPGLEKLKCGLGCGEVLEAEADHLGHSDLGRVGSTGACAQNQFAELDVYVSSGRTEIPGKLGCPFPAVNSEYICALETAVVQ